MNTEIIGPMDTFLELYINHAYRKAKRLQKEAGNLGVTLDELARMFKENPDAIEFNLSLLKSETEEEKNETFRD